MADADFTIADVLRWARTKPAREEYNFLIPTKCAAAQFGRETGRGYLVDCGNLDQYSHPLRMAVMGLDGRAGWTFGQLVARLEALVPPPVTQSSWTRADAYLADIESVSA